MDYTGPTPEPGWQAALDALAPPGGRKAWLRLVWEPGVPWKVTHGDTGETVPGAVHRWIVYQMFPPERTPPMVLADLRGRSPRERGHYDRVLRRFVPDPHCNVTRRQWRLYRETGCWGKPFWIVQGTRGGNKRAFTRAESMVSRIHGGPKQPPLPGDLPYARFDARVVRKIAQYDLVRKLGHLSALAETRPEVIGKYMDEDQVAYARDRVWDWIASQVSDVVRDADPLIKRSLEHLPTMDRRDAREHARRLEHAVA